MDELSGEESELKEWWLVALKRSITISGMDAFHKHRDRAVCD